MSCFFEEPLSTESVNTAVRSRTHVTVAVACAAWKKASMDLAKDLREEKFDSASIQLIILNLDEGEDVEDIALALQMKDVPSVNIYGPGGRLRQTLAGSAATAAAVRSIVVAIQSGDSCYSSSSAACCSVEDYSGYVSSSYANVVEKKASCCSSVDSSLCNYSESDIRIANEANLGLGCGNPMSFANLQPGESVLDLGSGAGIDCFLAAERVGSSGSVIGVDMTLRLVVI